MKKSNVSFIAQMCEIKLIAPKKGKKMFERLTLIINILSE